MEIRIPEISLKINQPLCFVAFKLSRLQNSPLLSKLTDIYVNFLSFILNLEKKPRLQPIASSLVEHSLNKLYSRNSVLYNSLGDTKLAKYYLSYIKDPKVKIK